MSNSERVKKERLIEIEMAIENFPKVLARQIAASEERKKRLKDFEPVIKALREKEARRREKTRGTTENNED